MTGEMVRVENLTKKYDDFTAVDDLNLSIDKGEIFALVGPNGAGKSTSMKMMVGLIEPSEGTAVVGGYDVVKDPLRVKEVIAYLPEDVSLYEDLTARQNVRYIADLNNIKVDKIDDILNKVGLLRVKDKKAGEFSKGMTQRLGLACVLVKEPKILFLDEPTTGLDPCGKIDVHNLLRNLKDRGMTIIFSSHILAEVKGISDRVGIIHRSRLGRILTSESIMELEDVYVEITGIA